jgi:hypothetical protein
MSFKRLDPEDFVVSADAVSSTVWTGNAPTLATFFYFFCSRNRTIRGILFKYIKYSIK